MGLAAAMTVHLACSEVTMPALEMEMLCCSMASWILVLSASFIWEDTKSGTGGGGGAHQSGYVDSAHLIELIDQTDSTVGQHQRSRLERPLTAHWVSLNISGQTNGGGPLTCGEHRTARDLLYVPADGNTLAHLLKQSFYSPNRFLHQHFTSVAQLRSRDTKYSPAYVNFRPLFFSIN